MSKKEISTVGFIVGLDGEGKELAGFFDSPDTFSWRRCDEDFGKILDSEGTYDEYIAALEKLLEREPEYLDAYSHIGGALLDCGLPQDALQWYQKGFDLAYSRIPKAFKGEIPWSSLDNRPFLRLHHGLILCHLQGDQYKTAAKMVEQHLRWNKNDNIGVRYLLGDCYLLAGMTAKAKKVLLKERKEECPYPPNLYSLALLEFLEGQYVKAATTLRRGFYENQYIAEHLTGRMFLSEHFWWHSSNLKSPETAEGYLSERMKQLWENSGNAIDFVDWLFNCSGVLKERAEFAAVNEGYTYEHDFSKRLEIGNRYEALKRGINDELSTSLIRKVKDRYGVEHWPWERPKRG